MNIRKISSTFVTLTCLTLAGCNTIADFKPVTRDGQEYIYDMPVIATGVVEDVQITEKNGTVHKVAAGASDAISQGGVGMAAATAAGGMSNVQGGLIGGGVGAVFDFISRVNAPKIEIMVRRTNEGDTKPLPVNPQSLKILSEYRCIDIGDSIKVVKKGSGFDVYNANPELLRLSDLQPSCQELKANNTGVGAIKTGNAQKS